MDWPVNLVVDVTAADLAGIAATIGAAGVVPDAAGRLVGVLPPLGELEAALPRVPLPGARRVLRFHLESASWVQRPFASEPGAYRLEQAFAHRRVPHPCGRRGGHRRARHGSAEQAPRRTALRARVAGLSSRPVGAGGTAGRGPARALRARRRALRRPSACPDEKQRVLLYHDVPQRVADALTSLLTS